MDGGNFPFSSFNADIPAPFLMFHSDPAYLYEAMERPLPEGGAPRSFNEFSYERIATAGSRPDVYRVWLKQTQHLGLSDSAWFVGQPVRGMLFGEASAETMLGAQNAFIRGFFDKHLKGEANNFPAPQLAEYEGRAVTIPNSDLPAWWSAKPEAERAALEARINAVKPRYEAPPDPGLATGLFDRLNRYLHKVMPVNENIQCTNVLNLLGASLQSNVDNNEVADEDPPPHAHLQAREARAGPEGIVGVSALADLYVHRLQRSAEHCHVGYLHAHLAPAYFHGVPTRGQVPH